MVKSLNPHMIGFPTFPKCSSAMFISTSFDATAPTLRCRGRAPSLAAGRGLGASMNCWFFSKLLGQFSKKLDSGWFWMILDDPSPNFSESFRYIVAFPLILSFVWEKKNWGFQIVSNWKHGQLGQRQFWVKCCLIIPVVEGSPVLPRGMSQGGFKPHSWHRKHQTSDCQIWSQSQIALTNSDSLQNYHLCALWLCLCCHPEIIWYVRPAKKCQETDVHFRSQCPRLLNDQDHLPFVLDFCNSSDKDPARHSWGTLKHRILYNSMIRRPVLTRKCYFFIAVPMDKWFKISNILCVYHCLSFIPCFIPLSHHYPSLSHHFPHFLT